jgi:hypothetical protein
VRRPAQPLIIDSDAHGPTAAAIVAGAPWSRPPLFVALGTGTTPAAADLRASLAFDRHMGSTFSSAGECPCHDLTATVVAAEPHLAEAPMLPSGVDTAQGLAWATTVADRRQSWFAAHAARIGYRSLFTGRTPHGTAVTAGRR